MAGAVHDVEIQAEVDWHMPTADCDAFAYKASSSFTDTEFEHIHGDSTIREAPFVSFWVAFLPTASP